MDFQTKSKIKNVKVNIENAKDDMYGSLRILNDIISVNDVTFQKKEIEHSIEKLTYIIEQLSDMLKNI